MSRTHRRIPPQKQSWTRDNEHYNNAARRGHLTMPLRHPDESFEEVGTPKAKRWAKRRLGRKRRLTAKKIISEQLVDK